MPKINLDDYDLDNYDALYDDIENEKQAFKSQCRTKKSSSYNEDFKKPTSHTSQNKIQTKARHHEELSEDDQDVKDEPIRTMAQAAREEAYQKRTLEQQRPQAPQARPSTAQLPFTFGPNTHEIKTIKIDFDRVVAMDRVQGEFKGNETFGIVFRFRGNSGSSRTIWFGRNLYERDAIFNAESRFWKSLQH